MDEISELKSKIARLESRLSGWVYLAASLTSADFDGGDAFSTTAKTLIDLSVSFGAPAGIRAVLLAVGIRDTASAANDCYLLLSPNNTAGSGLAIRCTGLTNNSYSNGCFTVPCDANGDIYYQINTSGAGTARVNLQIWGYIY
jgi:hypothetical protein